MLINSLPTGTCKNQEKENTVLGLVVGLKICNINRADQLIAMKRSLKTGR